MRVISWNILDGGEGRADPLGEVIEAQRPDIVALVEADVPVVIERIARRLAMDFIIAPGGPLGAVHSSALLSRYPITQTINHAGLNPKIARSFLEASVLAPDGNEWPIGVLHLPAGATEADESARMESLAIVLEIFKPHRDAHRPHLLCGDFNSTAPYQKIDLAKCKANTQQAWIANGQQLPTRVIEAVIAAGYLDTYSALHDEGSEMIGSFDTQHPGQRVDYIFSFGFGREEISEARVETDRLAKYASDHFPIIAVIGQRV